jgi:ribosomal protein S18 acetylase RimI-like enzyme
MMDSDEKDPNKIICIYVEPWYRGKGVAKYMLQHVVKQYPSLDMLYFFVNNSNFKDTLKRYGGKTVSETKSLFAVPSLSLISPQNK